MGYQSCSHVGCFVLTVIFFTFKSNIQVGLQKVFIDRLIVLKVKTQLVQNSLVSFTVRFFII